MTAIAGIAPIYAIAAFVIGMLVGMTGVGSGSLMTPVLILLFGIHPAVAVGTDLLHAAVTKTAGSRRARPQGYDRLGGGARLAGRQHADDGRDRRGDEHCSISTAHRARSRQCGADDSLGRYVVVLIFRGRIVERTPTGLAG